MMRRFSLLFPVLALASFAVAQTPSPPPVTPPKPTAGVQAILDKIKAANGQGKTEEAKRLLETAFVRARALNDTLGEARAFALQGDAFSDALEWEKAIAAYRKGQALHEKAGNLIGVAFARNNIGIAYEALGDNEKARTEYEQIIPLYRAVRRKDGEAAALLNLGNVYDNTGEPLKSLDCYQRSLALYAEVSDPKGEADARNGLANIYQEFGDANRALEYYETARAGFEKCEFLPGEAGTWKNIGIVHSRRGEFEAARAAYQKSLVLYEKMQEFGQQSGVYSNLGSDYEQQKQPGKALEFYQKALALCRKEKYLPGEATALNNRGIVYLNTGRLAEAKTAFQQALALRRFLGDREDEAATLVNIGLLAERQKQFAEAANRYRSAIALRERTAQTLSGVPSAQVGYREANRTAYTLHLRLLLKQGKNAEAFAVAQRLKARALLDLMAGAHIRLTGNLTPAERAREEALRRRCDDLNGSIIAEGVRNEPGSKKRSEQFQSELQKAERDLATFAEGLYARYPHLASRRVAKTATLAEVARLLTPDAALLEFVSLKIGDARFDADFSDETLLFVVTKNAAGTPTLTVSRLPLTQDNLNEKCDDLRHACSTATGLWQGKAKEMYALLLRPARKALTGKTRLILCPDGPLWGLPFAPLMDEQGKTLVETREISLAYSATGAIAAANAAKSATTAAPLLALADPDYGDESRFGSASTGGVLTTERPISTADRPISIPDRSTVATESDATPRGGRIVALPGTRQEADVISKNFAGALLFLGRDAQEYAVKQNAARCRYLHLATHGFLNDAAPLLSCLILAEPPKTGPGSEEDGFLTAREFFELDLSHCELAVLSACNTGGGRRDAGEGLIGLTWAIFAAGCPAQIVSQWSVNDASTAALMSRFYAALAAGKPKSAALRAAALTLKTAPETAHPYYWAPFILVGY